MDSDNIKTWKICNILSSIIISMKSRRKRLFVGHILTIFSASLYDKTQLKGKNINANDHKLS